MTTSMKKIMFAMTMMLGLATMTAHAQDTKENEGTNYNKAWYVGVNVGEATKATHNAWFKNLNTSLGLRIGKWISPYFGLELEANGYLAKRQFNTLKSGWYEYYFGQNATYPGNGDSKKLFKAMALGLNANVNLSNLINGVEEEPRSFEFIGKVGGFYGHDFSRFPQTLDENVLFRLGLGIAHNFGSNKQFQLYLEPAVIWDIYDDRGRGTYFAGWPDNIDLSETIFHSDRLAAQLKLGFNYKFGKKAEKVVEEPVVVVPPAEPKPEPKPVVKPEPKPEPKPVVVEEDLLKEVFFYEIRLSDPTSVEKLDKIAAWCKRHADKQITIDSYADRETGNPRLNVGYAKARATKCAKELEKRGVPKAQMIVNSYGDTVQPFAENDKNRCTIVVGK